MPSPAALAGLAADDSLLIRAEAARNPETPPGALAGLLGESMPGIRSDAVAGLGRHVLGSVLEESVPGGLAVARTPRVQRPAGTAFAVPLVPDLAVTDTDARLPASRVLDPAAVRLAVVIVSPGYGSAGDPALLVPYAEAGIAHVWRVEVDGDPVICVFRLDQGSCQLVTSARPGQLLAVTAPFPVTVDLAGLRQRLARWLTPAGERTGRTPAPDGTGGSGSKRAGTLARQAKADSAAARQEAASNRDTPPGILAELADDANWHVRRKAAGNANTPPGALDELACDPQWHVRLAAGNPHTPQGRLAALAGDEHWEVRRAIAARRPAPAALLDSLAHDPRREVRRAVASRPASPQALQALTADPFRQVRREVAVNPSAPSEVLARLAADDTEGAPSGTTRISPDPASCRSPSGTSASRQKKPCASEWPGTRTPQPTS